MSDPKHHRVLVVDDDPGIRLVCAAGLGLDGYEVIEAVDGQDGLERALTALPDLIILDVSMPVLDGFGLAHALQNHSRTKSVPIVFLTGEVDPAVRLAAAHAGAVGFFGKPFDILALSDLISRVLSSRTIGPAN